MKNKRNKKIITIKDIERKSVNLYKYQESDKALKEKKLIKLCSCGNFFKPKRTHFQRKCEFCLLLNGLDIKLYNKINKKHKYNLDIQ